MNKPALKVVQSPSMGVEEGQYWAAAGRSLHSLHYVIPWADSMQPDMAQYFIRRFSSAEDVILDPFSGRGTVALEAALSKRIAIASDSNPLAMRVTQAKLLPVDLAEVTLLLQQINIDAPVALDRYDEYFAPFYDCDTYRELCNLRRVIQRNPSRSTAFVELLALSLLHGHSSGFFSVYSFPQAALTPEAQTDLNNRRLQTPEYRAVVPRLIRKAASALRDGEMSRLASMEQHLSLVHSDARNLTHVPTASVDLVVTSPPRPIARDWVGEQWLQLWFAGIVKREVEAQLFDGTSIAQWQEFMNEVLFELARVVKPGGRAVFELKRSKVGAYLVELDDVLLPVIEEAFSRFWIVESLIVNKPEGVKLRHSLKDRSSPRDAQASRALVLRRK